MRTVRELGAAWQVQARSPLPEGAPDAAGPFPATVPGCVHTDLIAAGVIADLAVDGVEADQDWVQEVDWSWWATVDTGSEPASGPEPGTVRELVLDGLDTLATVSVDGRPVLTSSDRFHRHVLDISSQPTRFELRVDFAATLPQARRREAEWGTLPRPYGLPYNYLRTTACSFGWDWGPTTAGCGIVGPVLLHRWSVARWDEIRLRATLLDGVAVLDVAVSALGRLPGLVAEVTVGSQRRQVQLEGGRGAVRIEDPALEPWWPRGYGEPRLHDVRVVLRSADGVALDVDTRRVGFRCVALDTTPDDEGSTFALLVNGTRIWVRGFNWIPDDVFPHRVDAARYRDRIEHAVAAGANLLRVWGGGLFESDDFYDVCDELGVLVWQDFLFACAAYSQDDGTVAEVTREVTEAVVRLRHHAALVLWCGGNECLEGYRHWGWQQVLDGRPWGEHYYRVLIPGLLAELDGTRPYLPGTPYSADPDDDPNDSRSGTVHIWTTWNLLDYAAFEAYRPRFAAEFGYQAPAAWPTLTRATGVAVLDPDSKALAAHQKAAGEDKLALGLARHFPAPVTDPVAWYFAAQLLQARAVTVAIAHFRSQYERCAGTVWWQLNDCWPALSWAVLDVAGERRLGWHAIRDAYADRLAVVSPVGEGLRLTLVNDTDEDWAATPVLRHVHLDGRLLADGDTQVLVPARSARRLDVARLTGRVVDASVQEVLVVDVPGAPRATRWSRPDRALTPPPPDLVVAARPGPDGALAVDVTAAVVVRDLCLLPELRGFGYLVDGQLATLTPGERHTFTVRRRDPGPVGDALDDVADLLWSDNRVRHGPASQLRRPT